MLQIRVFWAIGRQFSHFSSVYYDLHPGLALEEFSWGGISQRSAVMGLLTLGFQVFAGGTDAS